MGFATLKCINKKYFGGYNKSVPRNNDQYSVGTQAPATKGSAVAYIQVRSQQQQYPQGEGGFPLFIEHNFKISNSRFLPCIPSKFRTLKKWPPTPSHPSPNDSRTVCQCRLVTQATVATPISGTHSTCPSAEEKKHYLLYVQSI